MGGMIALVLLCAVVGVGGFSGVWLRQRLIPATVATVADNSKTANHKRFLACWRKFSNGSSVGREGGAALMVIPKQKVRTQRAY